MPQKDNHSHTENSNYEILLSRRHFLYGVLGVGALATLPKASLDPSFAYAAEDELSVLEVPENAVITLDDFTEVAAEEMIAKTGNFELPYGTLIWANSDSVAACLLPTETSDPLTQVGVLFLGSGTYSVLLENAVESDQGFEIYDVRLNERGLIWTEANIFSGIWKIYTASLDGETVGEPFQVDEGDSGWETPTLAVVDSFAFWQVLPTPTGDHKTEASLLKRANFGKTTVDEVYRSNGRMSTPPYPLRDSLAITPRTDTSAVHYQLTHLEAASGTVTDTLVLPQSMKPLDVSYGTTGFAFTFDAIYSYGEGIANLGTYTPAEVHQPYDYKNKTWFRFNRTPLVAPHWCKTLFIVKSTRSVCGLDLVNKRFFATPVESGSDNYGDFLASAGTSDTFVTYANINDTAIDGETKKHCLVRIWTPLT